MKWNTLVLLLAASVDALVLVSVALVREKTLKAKINRTHEWMHGALLKVIRVLVVEGEDGGERERSYGSRGWSRVWF